jgi:hypothetical protein
MNFQNQILIPGSSDLYHTLNKLAEEAKVVCFCGLPGVGKSLYVQQFTLMAMSREREVTTLQWDLARQHFETPEVLEKFPEIDGITHAGIRKACGWWSRKAVSSWHREHIADNAILIVESPLIGNRLIELATQADDEAEKFLSNEAVQFVIPIPSEKLRGVIISKRENTTKAPKHEHEKADAQPHVLMLLYRELCEVAVKLGKKIAQEDFQHYNPEVYEFVYAAILKHRHFIPLRVNTVIKNDGRSVYETSGGNRKQLLPPESDVENFVRQVSRRFENEDALKQLVDTWYLV